MYVGEKKQYVSIDVEQPQLSTFAAQLKPTESPSQNGDSNLPYNFWGGGDRDGTGCSYCKTPDPSSLVICLSPNCINILQEAITSGTKNDLMKPYLDKVQPTLRHCQLYGTLLSWFNICPHEHTCKRHIMPSSQQNMDFF